MFVFGLYAPERCRYPLDTHIVAYCTSGAASVACSGRPCGLAWVHRPPLRDMGLGAHTNAVEARTYRMCAGVRGTGRGFEVGLEVITAQIIYPIYAYMHNA